VLDAIRDGPLEDQFRATLRERHEAYDPDARLLREETGEEPSGFVDLPPGTTVHPTRESLSYAVSLLDAGECSGRARAILDRVLDLQADDPDARYCGCWPWYAEVPLTEMIRVDENWAAFLGKQLVEVLADGAERLPGTLRRRTRQALSRATRFVRRRDVRPGYTNIALMSAFVAVAAGQVLADDDLLAYGRGALRDLVGYTRYHGGFTEYNSPTYTRVSLREIGRMLRYFERDDDRALARELSREAWRTLAAHYHVPTEGLAGPHLRAYANLDTDIDAYVHVGTGGVHGPDALNRAGRALAKLPFECPERYWRFFEPGTDPRFVRDRYYRGSRDGSGIPVALEARTYLTERFAIGTFSKAHAWSQSRPLIARWTGTDDDGPYYLRARWLRDGHDYASGAFAASQFEHVVVGAASLVTDNGDVHPAIYSSLEDPSAMSADETLTADRLAVRFEVGGDGPVEATEHAPGEVSVTAGGVTVRVTVARALVGDRSLPTRLRRVEDAAVDGRVRADVVLLEEGPTSIDLPATDAGVGFGVTIGRDGATERPAIDCATRDGRLVVTADGRENPGGVAVPLRPTGLIEYLRASTVA